MKITKEWLKEKSACGEGLEWFKDQKKDDGLTVLEALISDDKLDWANWLIVRIMSRPQYLAYAIFAAEQVIHIYEKKYPDDDRPRKAIEAAKAVLTNDTKETRVAAAYAAAAAAAAYAAAAADAAAAYSSKRATERKWQSTRLLTLLAAAKQG